MTDRTDIINITKGNSMGISRSLTKFGKSSDTSFLKEQREGIHHDRNTRNKQQHKRRIHTLVWTLVLFKCSSCSMSHAQ
jgi:hypothetical protein